MRWTGLIDILFESSLMLVKIISPFLKMVSKGSQVYIDS